MERIVVAVDKDKTSQSALKWAVDNLVYRDIHIITLVHVHLLPKIPNNSTSISDDSNTIWNERPPDEEQEMKLFLPFRCFCTRKRVQCEMVVLEYPEVAPALLLYVLRQGIANLLLGASSRNGLFRMFKPKQQGSSSSSSTSSSCMPSKVLHWVPNYCNVYIISKFGKLNTARYATHPIRQRLLLPLHSDQCSVSDNQPSHHNINMQMLLMNNRINTNGAQDEISEMANEEMDDFFSKSPDNSDRESTDSMCLKFYQNFASNSSKAFQICDDDDNDNNDEDDNINDLETTLFLSQKLESMEEEIVMLKIELEKTKKMYDEACKETLAEKLKAKQHQDRLQIREEEEVKKEKEKEIEKQLYRMAALKCQSLFHMFAVLCLFYFYFSLLK